MQTVLIYKELHESVSDRLPLKAVDASRKV
jgi:hypothetical protein